MPLLVFRADLGSALALLGLLFSIVLIVWVIGWVLGLQWGAEERAADREVGEEARRRFLLRLDHELKNPLTGLRAALANLGSVDTFPAASEQQGYARALRDAQHQVGRLSRLVADLRKLAELEERPIESTAVDLAELLEETVEAVNELPQYEGRRANLVISRVPWPLPYVTGDRDLLGLVFYNLVENAFKYSGADDAVEVRAVEDGRWLTVDVADSGPGISEEDIPRVFEELYRGSNARGLEGSGLGLALVRRVIDRHGGEITVRSRQEGEKGTVFHVRLPGTRAAPVTKR